MHQRCCRNSATFLDTPISAGNRRKNHLPSTCTFLRSMFEYFTKVLKNLRTTVKCHVKSWFTYTDTIHAVWKTTFHIETVLFQVTFDHSRGSIQSHMLHVWKSLDLHFVDLYGTLCSTNIAGWNITMFNRKYMFKGVHCPFSIC